MSYIRAHKGIIVGSCVAIVLVIAAWAWSFFVLRGISGPLIIHFTHAFGINQIGGIADLNEIGFLGLLMTAINVRLAFVLWDRNRIWSGIALTFTLFFTLLIFISFAAIIGVNR